MVERDPTYATASSSLSGSAIRQQFSTRVNIALSQYGIGFLRDAAAHLSVDGDAPALSLREPGYLYLAGPAGLDVLRTNHDVQRAAGVQVALLDPAALQARFPWLADPWPGGGIAGPGRGGLVRRPGAARGVPAQGAGAWGGVPPCGGGRPGA